MLRARRWRWFGLLAIVVGLSIVAYATRGITLPHVGHWLDVGEPPGPVDWLFVLPGDYETRPYAAAEIYKAGYASQVLLPPTVVDPDEFDGLMPRTHQIMHMILVARGVPESAIVVLDGQSHSTWSDAKALLRALDKEQGRKIAIVTNNYHSRRARLVFRAALADHAVDLHFFSVPTDRFSADDWWESREGFVVYTQEYAKLFAYWFRYGTGLWWLGGTIVLIAIAWQMRRRRAPKSVPAC